MKIIKAETIYHAELKTSEYDFVEVTKSEEDGRIQVRFLDSRWRSINETIEMFEDLVKNLRTLK